MQGTRMFGPAFEESGVHNRVPSLAGCMSPRYPESLVILGHPGKSMNLLVVKKVDQPWPHFLSLYRPYWFSLVNNRLTLLSLHHLNKKKYLKFNVLFKFKKKIKEYKQSHIFYLDQFSLKTIYDLIPR